MSDIGAETPVDVEPNQEQEVGAPTDVQQKPDDAPAPVNYVPDLSGPEKPSHWWQKILGNKGRAAVATAAIIAGGGAVDNATGGHGADAAGQTVSKVVNAGESVIKGAEKLTNPYPHLGNELQPGKVVKSKLVPLPPEGDNMPFVIRTSPLVEEDNIVGAAQYVEIGLDPTQAVEVKDVLGGTFNAQGFKVTINGVEYGLWGKIEGKDENGKPKDYFVAKTFVEPIEEAQPAP